MERYPEYMLGDEVYTCETDSHGRRVCGEWTGIVVSLNPVKLRLPNGTVIGLCEDPRVTKAVPRPRFDQVAGAVKWLEVGPERKRLKARLDELDAMLKDLQADASCNGCNHTDGCGNSMVSKGYFPECVLCGEDFSDAY